ncbi:sensor histidine kinase [Streptomyces scopuliridis]|uniref:sensor histidine kinase n=1 Tax=Streptomyces scopuliridis TaxID=452529 RepID=UPI002DDC3215|nr:sensor histidine kinase [Streptomyces scopuliridis]WSB31812.1 sensor histidine kinase [Streptomyces scopuliridis]
MTGTTTRGNRYAFRRLRAVSIARQFFLLQLGVLAVLVTAVLAAAYVEISHESESHAANVSLAVARTLAHSPDVRTALSRPEPPPGLQSLVETVRQANNVDFIVIARPDGTRCVHRDPTRLGTQINWDIAPVLNGHELTQFYQGRLGTSVRASAPVIGADSTAIGIVSVVMTQPKIGDQLHGRLPGLLIAAGLALLAAAFASFVISRRLRRQTLGLGPAEITRMYEHHDAVLHTVSQGLVVLGPDRQLVLANDEAQRLLSLGPDAEGRPSTGLTDSPSLRKLLTAGHDAEDEIHLAGERVLVVTQRTARRDGRLIGTVATLRDHTELLALTSELDSARSFAESLRAQAHEAANRLHTVVTLIAVGKPEKAMEFAAAELTATQQLVDRVVESIADPPVAALLLGKVAEAQRKGLHLVISDDTRVDAVPIDARDLISIVGNLVDNAIDAALTTPSPRRVDVTMRTEDDTLTIRVRDTGTGLDPATIRTAFTAGWSTKTADRPHGRGLGLALVAQVVKRHHGTIDVISDGGAIFTVRIPLRQQPERNRRPETSS